MRTSSQPSAASRPADPTSGPVLRMALALLVAVAAAVFLVANRADVPKAFRALRHASVGWVVAGLVASLLLVLAHSATRWAAMRAFDAALPFGRALESGAIAQSLNTVAKSGGMAGLVVYRRDAPRYDLSTSNITAGYVLAVALGDVVFSLTLLAADAVLIADGRFNRTDLIATVVFAIYFVVTMGALVASVWSRAALRRLHALFFRIRGLVLRRRTGRTLGDADEPDTAAADQLHDAVRTLLRRPAAAVPASVFALSVEVVNVTIVWLSLRAYGVHAGLTLPLVGYAVSVVVSIAGFLPAGLGFAEASLGAVLVSFGVPGATAAVVVITERLLEVWIPLAIGTVVAARRRAREPAR